MRLVRVRPGVNEPVTVRRVAAQVAALLPGLGGHRLSVVLGVVVAAIQVNRVAAARHLPVSTVRGLVAKYTQGRTLGFLGEPRVNVLNLNIALDELPG